MNALDTLNSFTIVFNTLQLVEHVTCFNNTYTFHLANGTCINIPLENLQTADFDEDHNEDPMYVVQDVEDITHTFKAYKNMSHEAMQELRGVYA